MSTSRELVDEETDAILGRASADQAAASDAAALLDGGAGIITIDLNGKVIPPHEVGQPWVGPVRYVYVPEHEEA